MDNLDIGDFFLDLINIENYYFLELNLLLLILV